MWNLEDIYNFKDTEKLIEEVKKLTEDFKKHRETLSDDISAEDFMKIIKEKEALSEVSLKLGAYAGLKLTENTADPKSIAHETKIDEVLTDLGNEMLFFSLWFKDLDDKKADELIKASGKYHYTLENIRQFKPYTLKEKEEQIINLKDLTGGSAMVRMYDLVTNRFRFDWDNKKVPQEEVTQHYKDPKREVRKKAYDIILSRYKDEEEVLGEIYRTIVNDVKNESIKLRKFKSPISTRNLGNDLPDEAVDALLKTVRKNIGLFQEYFKLKAKVIGLTDMDRYDLYAPFSKDAKEFSYEDSKKIVLDAYKEFNDQAFDMAKKIFDEEHVFSDMTENKQSGAFCWTVSNKTTPYILLNHMNKRKDVFTMAHEFGHGIHGLAAQNRTIFDFHSCLPLAETASTFGEMLLQSKFLKDATDEEKIDLIMNDLDNLYGTVVRQAYFTIFEKDAHALIANNGTVHDLNELYMKNLEEQYGDVVKIPEVFQHEWKYIPHFYHTPFYCYAYAFGNLLVLSLYDMYKKEGKEFIPKYFKILGYGGSESPQTILSEVGVDITKEEFWQKGFDLIKEELDELKGLLDK